MHEIGNGNLVAGGRSLIWLLLLTVNRNVQLNGIISAKFSTSFLERKTSFRKEN
jgi:hypothetical protein